MPINNEEVVSSQNQLNATIDGWTIEPARFEEMSLARLREFEQMLRREDVAVSKPKKKSIDKLLDEVSEANKEIFDSVNKIQQEIDTLEKTKLVELANKYDSLLFAVIGKKYTLKEASEKSKSGYYNTLIQQLSHTIRNITDGNEYNIEDFIKIMFRHISRFILIDQKTQAELDEMFNELYAYYNTISSKKKEKMCLMGREDKKNTVCEDYINGTNSSGDIMRSDRFRINLSTSY